MPPLPAVFISTSASNALAVKVQRIRAGTGCIPTKNRMGHINRSKRKVLEGRISFEKTEVFEEGKSIEARRTMDAKGDAFMKTYMKFRGEPWKG